MFRKSASRSPFTNLKNEIATIGALLVVPLALSACLSSTSAPRPVSPPDLSFDQGAVVSVQAMNIVFVEDYLPPLRKPNVEHEFSLLPVDVVRHWTNERLSAVGADGLFTVTVREASVVEEELPTTSGVQGRFRLEEDRKLTARLVVGVTYQGPSGEKSADFEVTAVKTLLESASLNDRERAYYWLIERLKHQTQEVMEEQIATTFSGVVG